MALFDKSKLNFDSNSENYEKTERGSFQWKDGIKNTEVIWVPNENGRFLMSIR